MLVLLRQVWYQFTDLEMTECLIGLDGIREPHLFVFDVKHNIQGGWLSRRCKEEKKRYVIKLC